jgi:hypothetical protein
MKKLIGMQMRWDYEDNRERPPVCGQGYGAGGSGGTRLISEMVRLVSFQGTNAIVMRESGQLQAVPVHKLTVFDKEVIS